MTVGTKSVLFGAHCFFLHPWFVAVAWWKLYGFPWDPRLWVAFVVHDLGYVGKPNMDGPEGETHPQFGGRVMTLLFDTWPAWLVRKTTDNVWLEGRRYGRWGTLCLLHSRYYAKQLDLPFSRLCVADKLAIALTPWWLYLPMVNLTGEVKEYLSRAQTKESAYWRFSGFDQRAWYNELRVYMLHWVAEHKDGKVDTWTRKDRNATGPERVWR